MRPQMRPKSRSPRATHMEDLALDKEADARTRTGDPFITSEVLCQLSYVGERGPSVEATRAIAVAVAGL